MNVGRMVSLYLNTTHPNTDERTLLTLQSHILFLWTAALPDVVLNSTTVVCLRLVSVEYKAHGGRAH